jgi:hypothetical protein
MCVAASSVPKGVLTVKPHIGHVNEAFWVLLIGSPPTILNSALSHVLLLSWFTDILFLLFLIKILQIKNHGLESMDGNPACYRLRIS